ncbi:MAG: hypothetical protein CMJ49_13920 [Planctomycetaceae bacterium]|nr:hypothetical protein [Planctomycetaceae bacterium]
MLILLCLTVLTAAIYARAVTLDFLAYDDGEYVTQNGYITGGLTAAGFKWVFTSPHGSNFHPLTGISHMLDCQWFHDDPSGHHLVNVVLHVANTLLLYTALWFMTRRLWCAAFVAALFALHPQHVESVAWISERKDVLSGCFGFITIIAYARYAQHGGIGKYLVTALALALGLMAKPMLVTWPCLLLLLDVWPLRRVKALQPQPSVADAAADQPPTCAPRSIGWLLLEKLPLFALAAFASVMTIIMQGKTLAIAPTDVIPMTARYINAIMSYVRYLGRTIWPDDLAAMYPHPFHPGGTPWANVWVIIAAVALIITTVTVLILWRRRPYLAVGWLWYLGTLVPVIGIVQVGSQAMADRFTYLPIIGIYIAATWCIADLLRPHLKTRAVRSTTAAIAALIILACATLTWSQIGVWKSDITLFTHNIRVIDNAGLAHINLGNAYRRRAEDLLEKRDTQSAYESLDKAVEQFQFVFRIVPNRLTYREMMFDALVRRGRLDEAREVLVDGLLISAPDLVEHNRRPRQSLYIKLKGVFNRPEWVRQAVQKVEQSLEANPNHTDVQFDLATFLANEGQSDNAIHHLQTLLSLDDTHGLAHHNLSKLMSRQGRLPPALAHAQKAVQLLPDEAWPALQLGKTLAAANQLNDAIPHFHRAQQLEPDTNKLINEIAWILATHPGARPQHISTALALAERACEQTNYANALCLRTLAAVHAAAGRTDKAVRIATAAIQIAKKDRQHALVQQLTTQLQQYRWGNPYREAPGPGR